MENYQHNPGNSNTDNDDHHHSSGKQDLDSLFPTIENSDINLQVDTVNIVVFKNCTSIYIQGKTTKIYFDIPSTADTSLHTDSKNDLNSDNKGEHETHTHTHDENKVTENTSTEGHSHIPQPKHVRETDSAPHKEHDHTHDANEHQHEDEIDLSCEGVQILLCDCCTILKIKGTNADLKFPLDNFKKANVIQTEENGYYVRRYKIELWKHVTNPSDQKLFINGKAIDFEYNPSLQGFTTHLFFREYKNILDLMVDYLKANPELGEFKHHH